MRDFPLRTPLAWAIAALTVLGAEAQAQEEEAPWRSELELGLNGASGNSSFAILRTGASLTRENPERYEFEISGLLRYGKNRGRVIANDFRATFRYDWIPQADLSPFVLAVASRDRIRRLDSKVIAGGGAKWTFWRAGESTKASLSLAAIVDRENFTLDPASGATGRETKGRWSTRFKFDHAFGTGASFQQVTFWQPELGSANDYLLEMVNSLSSRLVANLSLILRHEFLHDEVPPPGIGKNDHRFSASLRISL